MDWSNYLLEEKAPLGSYAHLGVLAGEVGGIYNLLELPPQTKALSMTTPIKKSKLKFTNLEALAGNEHIEAISLTDIDDERVAVFSSLPNLKYLKISFTKESEIPSLSPLKSLKVLILANMTKISNIDFIRGLDGLKTLYIYGVNNLYNLMPLSTLTGLEELSLDHGKMSGVGKPVKSLQPISELVHLKYLSICLSVEGKDYSIDSLLGLKKLEFLYLLPRYLVKGQKERLADNLPLVRII